MYLVCASKKCNLFFLMFQVYSEWNCMFEGFHSCWFSFLVLYVLNTYYTHVSVQRARAIFMLNMYFYVFFFWFELESMLSTLPRKDMKKKYNQNTIISPHEFVKSTPFRDFLFFSFAFNAFYSFFGFIKDQIKTNIKMK